MGIEEKLKWKDTDKSMNPVEFYQQRYSGLTRSKLFEADQALYHKLRRDGNLDVVPYAKNIQDFGDDSWNYFQENYNGITRGELAKCNIALYNRMRRDGSIEKVLRAKTKFGINPLKYYNKHHKGQTRGYLRKHHRSLYQTLWKAELLDHIPKE